MPHRTRNSRQSLVPIEEAPDRARRKAGTVLAPQQFRQLDQRDVHPGINRRQDHRAIRLDPMRPFVAALPLRPHRAGAAPCLDPAHRARRSHAEPLGRRDMLSSTAAINRVRISSDRDRAMPAGRKRPARAVARSSGRPCLFVKPLYRRGQCVEPELQRVRVLTAEAGVVALFGTEDVIVRARPEVEAPELLPVWWTRSSARGGDPLELHRAEIADGRVASLRIVE